MAQERLAAVSIHLVLVQVPIYGVEVLVYVNRVINTAVRAPVMPAEWVRPAEENMQVVIVLVVIAGMEAVVRRHVR